MALMVDAARAPVGGRDSCSRAPGGRDSLQSHTGLPMAPIRVQECALRRGALDGIRSDCGQACRSWPQATLALSIPTANHQRD